MARPRWHVLSELEDAGILPIVRAATAATAREVALALVDAGATVLEVSLTVPGALKVVEELVGRHGDSIVVGAGTVLDAEGARHAIASGAGLLVTPVVAPDVASVAHRYQVPVIMGAATPSEVLTAIEEGADAVKLFPAKSLGPDYLRALRAALPQAPVVPTGGITLDGLSAWFRAGAMAVGVGSELVGSGEPAVVAAAWRRWRRAVAEARAPQAGEN